MIEPSFDLSAVSWVELDVSADLDMADLIAAWVVHHEQGEVESPRFWAWEAGDHLASHYPAQALGFVMATFGACPFRQRVEQPRRWAARGSAGPQW